MYVEDTYKSSVLTGCSLTTVTSLEACKNIGLGLPPMDIFLAVEYFILFVLEPFYPYVFSNPGLLY